MNRSKQITEGALFTAVYIVLFLIVFFIPLLQLFGLFVLPIPFAIYAARYGWKSGVIMGLAAFLLTAVFATVAALPFTIFASIGGVVIGQGIKQVKNAYEIWARGTIGFLIGFVLIIAALQLLFSINIFTEINTMMDEMMEMMRSVVAQMNVGEMEDQFSLIEEQIRQLPDLLPSSLVIMSIIFALITQWLTYKVMNRLQQEKSEFPPFRELNFPVSIIWIYFVVIIASFFDLEQGSTLAIVMINARAVLSVLLMIQGFSFVFFFADQKKIHKAVPIGVVIVTLFIPFLFMFLIEIIGIIDLGFSLKKRISKDKT